MRLGLKHQRPKSSKDGIMSAVEFYTNEIQAQKHWWKICVDHKENTVEKLSTFVNIWTFLADPYIYIYI